MQSSSLIKAYVVRWSKFLPVTPGPPQSFENWIYPGKPWSRPRWMFIAARSPGKPSCGPGSMRRSRTASEICLRERKSLNYCQIRVFLTIWRTFGMPTGTWFLDIVLKQIFSWVWLRSITGRCSENEPECFLPHKTAFQTRLGRAAQIEPRGWWWPFKSCYFENNLDNIYG